MEGCFSLLLVFLSCLLNVNGRTFPSFFPTIIDSDQDSVKFRVVENRRLSFLSTDEDLQHEYKLGQVTGLAASVRNPNRLLIFHRASTQWNPESFPDGVHFNTKKFDVIPENTILIVDTRSGQILDQWGNNSFYMPHGLSVDVEENLWLTDVAMHQVFKYSNGKLVLKLGELFIPGRDSSHFCKPTDVVVSNDGSNVYVADGYCNSRIVKLDSQGNFLKEYSMPEGEKALSIPHSLTLIETFNLVCVADRENGRIVCFDGGIDDRQTNENDEGQVKVIIQHRLMRTVNAIHADTNKHRLYAIGEQNGESRALGFTFSVDPKSFGELISTWQPNDRFGQPHDLTLSANGRSLFVGEINPNRIDSFDVLN